MNTLKQNSKGKNWLPHSWKNFIISQQPVYLDSSKVEDVKSKLQLLPPLVNSKEIDFLKEKLKKCHNNEKFIIQVGDCAERFIDCSNEVINKKIIFYNLLSHILGYHLKKEIIILGRIGGQYAKPRSNDFELIGERQVQVFRGEIINDLDPNKRTPDPERMCTAYHNSAFTVSLIENWNLFEDKSLQKFKNLFRKNIFEIKSENFLKKMMGYYNDFPENPNVEDNSVYCSHEGLLLDYEECLVRSVGDSYYDLSGHFLWIGERTGSIHEAHIEFFRGINNPIGIKISSRTDFDDLIKIIKILNPENENGKIVIITRFGATIAETYLSSFCSKIKNLNLNIIIICDPNHGNTKLDQLSRKKVRYFDEMLEEIVITHDVLSKNGLFLSGIHLEASSFDITECLGGIENKVERIIDECYTSYCDPRLNMLQTMELCDLVGKHISNGFI